MEGGTKRLSSSRAEGCRDKEGKKERETKKRGRLTIKVTSEKIVFIKALTDYVFTPQKI